MRRLYLHIGLAKTGTTALQLFLKNNETELRNVGFTYLCDEAKPYFYSHAHFPVAGSLLDRCPMFIPVGKFAAPDIVLGHLTQDLSTAPYDAIISCEHLSLHINNISQIKLLQDALSGRRVTLVCYLRRPDDFGLSLYTTAIRSGRRSRFHPNEIHPKSPNFHFLRILRPWASVFGDDNIIVRKYDRQSLINSDICHDFLQLIGVSDRRPFHFAAHTNISPNALQIEVLRNVNKWLPAFHEDPSAFQASQWIRDELLRHLPAEGPPITGLLSGQQRRVVLARFTRINAALERAFPTLGSLDDWNPDRQGDAPKGTSLVEPTVDVFAKVLAEVTRKLAETTRIGHGSGAPSPGPYPTLTAQQNGKRRLDAGAAAAPGDKQGVSPPKCNTDSIGAKVLMKKFIGKSDNAVSRDEIIWCYRTLLGRDPESENAILAHARHKNLQGLVEVFLRSTEFHQRLKNGVSREDIVWCYRKLLGREPESETAILSHVHRKDFQDLVEWFIRSPELLDKTHLIGDAKAVDHEHATPIGPKENEVLGKAEYAAGILVVRSSPRMLTLETSSRCNLRCVMCPQAINAVDRPKHLEEELVAGLEKFIRQSRSIQLHGIGEPLASPAFWNSLKFIPDDCDASINTNLTVLDDQRLTNLLNSAIKIVNVSLDAARPETYQKIRGYSFATVVGNIQRFLQERQAKGKRVPRLYMNMTLMRSNIEELLEFIELAVSLGADAVCLWHLNRWPDEEMARYVLTRDGWVFDYRKEGLWNFPALSNKSIRKAVALARQKGMQLILGQNKIMYFEEQADNRG